LSRRSAFKCWSMFFIVLMSLLTISILTHDLALLDDDLRESIFTLSMVCDQLPVLRRYVLSLRCWIPSDSGRRLYKPLCNPVLFPFWVILKTVAFMAVVYPFTLVSFVFAPIRMSRMMVFLSSILCCLWSLVFILLCMTWYHDSIYTILWSFVAARNQVTHHCVCACTYPLRRDVCFRMITLGTGVLAHSGSLAFRALKGLRRAQWANLFSVMYTVPMSVFPVVWERPIEAGGGPVRHRLEAEPVQGEPAFDPFCLMDEQPESDWTRINLAPASRNGQLQNFLSSLSEEVSLCGFPRLPDGIHSPLLRNGGYSPLLQS